MLGNRRVKQKTYKKQKHLNTCSPNCFCCCGHQIFGELFFSRSAFLQQKQFFFHGNTLSAKNEPLENLGATIAKAVWRACDGFFVSYLAQAAVPTCCGLARGRAGLGPGPARARPGLRPGPGLGWDGPDLARPGPRKILK